MKRDDSISYRHSNKRYFLAFSLLLVILIFFSFNVGSLELEQEFRVEVNLSLYEDNTTSLFFGHSSSVQGTVENNKTLDFYFDVSYFDKSLVNCTYLLKKGLSNFVNETLNAEKTNYEESMFLSSGNYSWQITFI